MAGYPKTGYLPGYCTGLTLLLGTPSHLDICTRLVCSMSDSQRAVHVQGAGGCQVALPTK